MLHICTMNLQIRLLIAVIFCLFLGRTASASHFHSSEMRWHHLGNRIFDFYVTYLHDCSGVAPSITALNVEDSTGSFIVYVASIQLDTVDLFNAQCAPSNPCAISTFNRYIKRTVRYRVDLRNRNHCNFYIHANDCCRMSYLNAMQPNSYPRVEARLSLCGVDSSRWSSPYFVGPIHMSTTVNDLKQMSFLAYDSLNPGDSLRYELVNPTDGANLAQYNQGYSYLQPIRYDGYPSLLTTPYGKGFALDESNGMLVFRPTQANQFSAVAVKVSSYKKVGNTWQLFNTMVRESMLVTLPSNYNSSPSFVSPPSVLRFCDSAATYVDLALSDTNSLDSFSYEIDGEVPPYSISDLGYQNGQKRIRLQFQLDASHWRSDPYYFVLTVKDNHCSPSGYGVAQLSLKLIAEIDTAFRSSVELNQQRNCNTLTLSSTIPNSLQANFQWTIGQAAPTGPSVNYSLHNALDTLAIRLNYRSGACHIQLQDTFFLDSVYHFSGRFETPSSVSCYQQVLPVYVKDISGGLGIQNYRYGNLNSTLDSFLYSASDTVLNVFVFDSSGCFIDTTLNFSLSPSLTRLSADSIALCTGNVGAEYYAPQYTGGAGPYTLTWYNGMQSDSILIQGDALQMLTLSLQDSIGCRLDDTLYVRKAPRPTYQVLKDDSLCFGEAYLITIQNSATQALFDFGSGFQAQNSIQFFPSQDSLVHWQMKDTLFCTIADSFKLHLFPERPLVLSTDTFYCAGDSLTLSVDSSLLASLLWVVGQDTVSGFANTFTGQSLGAYPIQLLQFTLNGCAYISGQLLEVRKVPDGQISLGDRLWCQSDDVVNLYDSVSPATGIWFIDGNRDSLVDPAGLSRGFHSLRYRLDSIGCRNESTFTIHIGQVPQVNALIQNSQGIGPLQVQFQASVQADTNYTLSWNFDDGSAGQFGSPVNHTYQNKGVYSPTLRVETPNCSIEQVFTNEVVVYYRLGLDKVKSEVKVFPNPGSGDYFISGLPAGTLVRLFDALGKEVQVPVAQNQLNAALKVDLHSLASGIYTFRFILPDSSIHSVQISHQP